MVAPVLVAAVHFPLGGGCFVTNPPTGAKSYQRPQRAQSITDLHRGQSGEDTSVPTNDAARMAKAMLDKVVV